MTRAIDKVAVLGAGTMGAAIAAHVANAGLPVLLLDIVPSELTEAEAKKGLSLDQKVVRDRIARDGLARIAKLKPASFMSQKAERLVSIGNLEDDLERLAEVDWIVEAVIEKLDIKRDLMSRVDAVRRPGTVVTTNTSGLPIHSIAEGLSDDFRKHFFGTHFFNPPRYMKLLEVIPGDEADPEAVERLSEFATRHLGKGVVRCKDTPNFIGNRVLSVHGSATIEYALAEGYRFEEVDVLTGPLVGRPKTATFRLQDLVGIDIAWYVAQNLHDLIPDDPRRDVLHGENASRVIGGLLERGRKGNKTGAGFYKKGRDARGKTVFEVLDPETFEYEAARDVEFASVAALSQERDLGARLRGFFDPRWDDDRGARFVRRVVTDFVSYAAAIAPEVAFDLWSVDRAVRWGFAHEQGPFELWDAIGVTEGIDHVELLGFEVAPWVREMLDAGCGSFYRRDDDGRVTGAYDWQTKGYVPVPKMAGRLAVDDLRAAAEPVASNRSASIHDTGDGILLFELHSKALAIDAGVVEMLQKAVELLADDAWSGLVIGHDGPNFCVGANLHLFLKAAEEGRPEEVGAAAEHLQMALAALRRRPEPVVAALHGMALGGGAELCLGANRVVAHAESYMGLVEAGVGLLPAGGGLMELVRRLIDPATHVQHGDPLPAAQKAFENAAMAKVSTSAENARELGFLRTVDRVVMHRDLLLAEARAEVQSMITDGWVPEPEALLYAGGAPLRAALLVAAWSLRQAGWASEHDAFIAGEIAHVLCGGDATVPGPLPESHFLRLERDGITRLAGTEKTQARMGHMLKTGKPLRN